MKDNDLVVILWKMLQQSKTLLQCFPLRNI